jgi:L-aspartate oxidase
MKTDVLIVGCGVGGLYTALNLPEDKNIIIITKAKAEESDSYLAQGGICVLKEESDYEAYFEDTMRAGHYENDKRSVEIMIRSSRDVIDDLVRYGARFERNEDGFVYTKEGAHSKPRILFHRDETGKEITSHLLDAVRKLKNVKIIENYTMVDLLVEDEQVKGVLGHNENKEFSLIEADYTVLATGGIGGLYKHSTNFPHLTGDALALSLKYGIKLKNIDYIQIHPTTLLAGEEDREFLISESVRGEGAILLNSKGERFTDELQPRDVVANAIFKEMEKEKSKNVWLSMSPIPEDEIKSHFKNIYEHCLSLGFDVTKEPIPVVPSQHYFMGGIAVDEVSKTSMDRLYAVGETSCNGVHGKNRLASNSLLESLVFAKRAAKAIISEYSEVQPLRKKDIDFNEYENYQEEYKQAVLSAIEKERNSHE